MKCWPEDLSLNSFKSVWRLEGDDFWFSVFEMHKGKMQIKNPEIAIRNLEKIFTATFKLANAKGFEAMSLRDLSSETGISMGGLYAYIGSKNDLASIIEGVLRRYIEKVFGALVETELKPVDRLQAIIFGQIHMAEIMNSWYNFCFMELRGLPKEQQQKTMELELRFDEIVMQTIEDGIRLGQFSCSHPEIQAIELTAALQQCYLKRWKMKNRKVTPLQYGDFLFCNLLESLKYKDCENLDSHSAFEQNLTF